MSAVLRLVDWSDESDVPEPAGSAIERYKEIVATATDAHARMRAHDAACNAELNARIAQTQERVAEISEREQMVRFGAELHWEAAKKQLWNETWFRMTVFPKPDESVPPRPQSEYNAAMDAAYDMLEASLQKKPLLRRR